MTTLVTGSNGLVGSALKEVMKEDGAADGKIGLKIWKKGCLALKRKINDNLKM